MKRSAKAVWKGTVKDGNGVLTTQSTTLNETQYSFKSRFTKALELIRKNYWPLLTPVVLQ